jgi:hypothetical protein
MGSFRGKVLSISDVIEELIESGGSKQKACSELQNAIEARVLTLIDPSPDPADYDQVVGWAIQVIRAHSNLDRCRPILMMGVPNYVATLRVARVQFEEVFELAGGHSQKEPSVLAEHHPSIIGI